jgi:hypothetical protein
MHGAGIDAHGEAPHLPVMTRDISINARWDGEAAVWIARSEDVPGLVVEAESWPSMIEEVRVILPDLLELNGQPNEKLSVTFKAEEHLDLAGA